MKSGAGGKETGQLSAKFVLGPVPVEKFSESEFDAANEVSRLRGVDSSGGPGYGEEPVLELLPRDAARDVINQSD